MNGPPLLAGSRLRSAGRTPPIPFRIVTNHGESIDIVRMLRVLPGKRMVGEARWHGQPVLAKLFIANDGNSKLEREARGIRALRGAGLPTPELLLAGEMEGGGGVLLTQWLDDTATLADLLLAGHDQPPRPDMRRALLARVFQLVGRLHASRLLHEDPHFGNFLLDHENLYLIDGDGILRNGKNDHALTTRNLALLIAQLPVDGDDSLDELLAAYRAGNPDFAVRDDVLVAAVRRQRARRLRNYLAKLGRDCTRIQVTRNARAFVAVVREAAAVLAPVLAEPDDCMAHGVPLKDGRTSTVALIQLPSKAVIVKRYNLKNIGHALGRCWRPSRAWHSWREAHRLRFLGIATPAPLAMIESRLGPFRGRAWLISEYCAGTSLRQQLSAEREPEPEMAGALLALFAQLHREYITHGDLKASNLLWHEQRIVLIDLDAVRQHRSRASYLRAWARDRARLLRNWPADSPLHRWLDARLPRA